MTTVAELGLSATAFALGETFAAVPGARVEIEPVVAHGDDRVLPFVRIGATEGEGAGIRAALETDDSVEAYDRLADLGGEWRYRVAWADRVGACVRTLTAEGGTILAAVGRDGRWQLRLLFPDREALARTHARCADRELAVDVEGLYRLDAESGGRFGLTDAQRDTLALALEHGYYEIPRDVPAQALAAEIGISHQALSERIRRAHENLVENSIVLGNAVGRDRSNRSDPSDRDTEEFVR